MVTTNSILIPNESFGKCQELVYRGEIKLSLIVYVALCVAVVVLMTIKLKCKTGTDRLSVGFMTFLYIYILGFLSDKYTFCYFSESTLVIQDILAMIFAIFVWILYAIYKGNTDYRNLMGFSLIYFLSYLIMCPKFFENFVSESETLSELNRRLNKNDSKGKYVNDHYHRKTSNSDAARRRILKRDGVLPPEPKQRSGWKKDSRDEDKYDKKQKDKKTLKNFRDSQLAGIGLKGEKIDISFKEMKRRFNYEKFLDVRSESLELNPIYNQFSVMFKDFPFAMSVGAFLYQIMRATNFGDYVAAFYQMASIASNNSDFNMDSILRCAMDTWSMWPFKSEALSDDVKFAFKQYDTIISSDLVVSLRKVVLSLVSFNLVGKDISSNITSWLGQPPDMSYASFIPYLGDTLVNLIRAGEHYQKGLPLSNLLFIDQPVKKATFDAMRLLGYKDFLYSGRPIEGGMSKNEFIKQMSPLVRTLKAASESPFYSAKVREATNNLYINCQKEMNTVQLDIESSTRVPPFFLINYGDPSVGKSVFNELIFSTFDYVLGYENNKNNVYHCNFLSEYFDGCNPFEQPYIHAAETGNMLKSIAEKQGDPLLIQICSIHDSSQYKLNMAAVDLKGKVSALFKAGVFDTNNIDLNAQFTVNNPTAIWRRFLFMVMSVKVEWRKPGCKAIDSAKVLEHVRLNKEAREKAEEEGLPIPPLFDPFDVWNFKFFIREAVSLTQYQEIVIFKTDNYKDALKCIEVKFREHLERGEQIKNTFNDAATKIGTILSEGKFTEYERRESAVIDAFPRERKRGPVDFKSFKEVRSESLIVSVSTYFLMNSIFRQGLFYTLSALSLQFIDFIVDILSIDLVSKLTYTIEIFKWIIENLIWFGKVCINIMQLFLVRFQKKLMHNKIKNQVLEEIDNVPVEKIKASLDKINWNEEENVERSKWIKFAGLLAIAVGIFQLYRSTGSVKDMKSETISKSYTTDPIEEEISKLEQQIEAEDKIRVINYSNPPQWNIRERPTPDPINLNNYKEIYNLIKKNVKKVIINHDDEESKTYITGLYSNFAIINRHAFGDISKDKNYLIEVLNSNDVKYANFYIKGSDIQEFRGDAVVIQCSQMNFLDIRKFLTDQKPWFSTSGYISDNDIVCRLSYGDAQIPDGTYMQGYWSYDWKDHRSGLCGTPLLTQIGKGWYFTGIHTAGNIKNDSCYAQSFFKEDLKEFTSHPAIFEPLSENPNIVGENLTTPSSKSPFRYEHLPFIRYFGRTNETIHMNNYSEIRQSPFCEEIEKLMPVNMRLEDGRYKYSAPKMRPFTKDGVYYSPYNRMLRKMNRPQVPLNKDWLSEISEVLVNRFSQGRKLRPTSLQMAINGYEKDPISRRINVRTSAGYGWPGKKSRYLPIGEENPLIRYATPDLKKALLERIKFYTEGLSKPSQSKTHLKDEARLTEKVDVGNTRLFYASTIEFIILCRQFLYPFFSEMVEFNKKFCTPLGVDMHSQAHELYEELMKFKKVIEGDYGTYEIVIPIEVTSTAFNILMKTFKNRGYNAFSLKVTQGILTDILFPLININGDVIQVPGMQPSGINNTLEINCLKNLIWLMYLYKKCYPERHVSTFFDFVVAHFVGDDLRGSVDDCCEKFNNIYLQEANKEFGIEFTPASKKGEHKEFLDLEDSTFLKRGFRYHPVLGCMVAPLSMESIARSMMFILPSKTISSTEQYLETCKSALWELFFHVDDEDSYNFYRDGIHEILKKHTPLTDEDLFDLPRFSFILNQIASKQIENHQDFRSESLTVSSYFVLNISSLIFEFPLLQIAIISFILRCFDTLLPLTGGWIKMILRVYTILVITIVGLTSLSYQNLNREVSRQHAWRDFDQCHADFEMFKFYHKDNKNIPDFDHCFDLVDIDYRPRSM